MDSSKKPVADRSDPAPYYADRKNIKSWINTATGRVSRLAIGTPRDPKKPCDAKKLKDIVENGILTELYLAEPRSKL